MARSAAGIRARLSEHIRHPHKPCLIPLLLELTLFQSHPWRSIYSLGSSTNPQTQTQRSFRQPEKSQVVRILIQNPVTIACSQNRSLESLYSEAEPVLLQMPPLKVQTTREFRSTSIGFRPKADFVFSRSSSQTHMCY